jgi:hypothetical protein
MTPAVARMRHASLPQNQATSRPFTPAHSRLYDMIRTTFGNAAEILGIPNPELLLGDPSAPIAFGATFVPFGGVLVAPQTVEGRADTLVYMAGKRLAELRPELYARAYFSAPDLQTLLGAAVRVSRHEGAKDTAATALDCMAAIDSPSGNVTADGCVWTVAQRSSLARSARLRFCQAP